MTVSRLLKSCAMRAASWPSDSCLLSLRSSCSVRRRSVMLRKMSTAPRICLVLVADGRGGPATANSRPAGVRSSVWPESGSGQVVPSASAQATGLRIGVRPCFLEKFDVFVERLAEQRVALDAQQVERGFVGLHDPAAEVGGNHPVGDGAKRDGQPFGLGGERAAGLAALGHVAVNEDRLSLVGRRSRARVGGVQRLGGHLQPAPASVLVPQAERADEGDPRDDALAEFFHHAVHVLAGG